jgi:hypothetical protein
MAAHYFFKIGATWSRKCSIMSNVVWFFPLVSSQLVKILVFWLVVDVDLKILALIRAILGLGIFWSGVFCLVDVG